MKKILLIALALGIGMASFAQKDLNAFTKITPAWLSQISIADPNPAPLFSILPVKLKPMVVAQTKAVSSTLIGTSGNMLTVQMQNIRDLSTNPDLSIIAFTHRSGGSHGPSPVNLANHSRVSFSTDGGVTFNDMLLKNDTNRNNRYPTGIVVNKTGNTDAMQATIAYGGPYHVNPNNKWTGHYLCSEKFDGSIYNLNYHPWTVLTGVSTLYPYDVSIIDAASCSDQTVHGATVYYDGTTAGHIIFKYAEMINGTLTAADTVNYSYVQLHPTFAHVPSDPTGVNYFNTGQAWSEDGNTGYIYFFAIDSLVSYHNSVEPIVYKSVDKGLTWTKMPVFDFSTIQVIRDSVWRCHADTSLTVPAFFSGDESGVVDANGNLHIVTIVASEYTDNADSIGYTFLYEPQKLFDVYTTTSGWGANYITRINSVSVRYTDAVALPSVTAGANAMGWDHRLNASRTLNGQKIFVTYADEADTTGGQSKLIVPDLCGYAWDVSTGYHTNVVNFTNLTSLYGVITWSHGPDRVLTSGTDYIIPVTYTTVGAHQEDTCQHYYLSGISFNMSDFVGINEVKGNISIVTQNYPNPFNSNTNITVSLSKTSDLTLTVTDMLGQKVYESYKGTVSAGTHNYTFDGSQLNSGIYFYTLQAGQDKVTHKMIIE